jgi:hypothetical protein
MTKCWGPWALRNGESLHLHASYGERCWIDLTTIHDSAQIYDQLSQVGKRKWATNDIQLSLLNALLEVFNPGGENLPADFQERRRRYSAGGSQVSAGVQLNLTN